MSTEEPIRLLSREFVTLGLATMLFFGAMGAANPILPKFVADVLHGSDTTVGIVMGSFAVSSLALRVWFGRLGGRRGARLLVLAGCVLGAGGMLLFAAVHTVALALVARLVLGAAQAALMTGSTVLAIDLAPVARRGEAASYILVAFHLGLGLGPVVGESVLHRSSYHRVFLVLGAMMIAGMFVAFLLPRRPGHPDAPTSPWLHPTGVAPGLVAAFGIVAFVSFSTFVPLYAREIGLDNVAPVFVVASIAIALVRIAASRVPDRIGPIRSGTIALGVTVVGTVVLAAWSAVPGVYLAAAVLAGGMALQTPSLIPVAVHGVDPHERASAMATFTMFMDLSVALTAPVFGLIAGGAGYRLTFLTGGVAAAIAVVLLYTVLAPRWRAATAPQDQLSTSVASS